MNEYPMGRRPTQCTADWTDERIELLKKLWFDGLSASQVAAELGDVTRNAVIGKVHRLGLERTKGWKATHPGRRGPRSRPSGARVSRGGGVFVNVSQRMAMMPIIEPEPVPEIDDSGIPVAQRRTLQELNAGTCRWPVGDPRSAEFFFCGAEPVACSPYCGAHTWRAGGGFGRGDYRNIHRWAA